MEDQFSLMYRSYINGNLSDHRSLFYKLSNYERMEYLIYIFSVSGREYPRILKSLGAK